MRKTPKERIEDLLDVLASGAASVLVGAGSSMACGYPGWDGFLRLLAQEIDPAQAARLMRKGLTLRADALQDALYTSTGNHRRFRQVFRSSFDPNRATLPPPQWLQSLFAMTFRVYITTNYTDELERTSRDFGFAEGLRWRDKGTTDLVLGLEPKRVLYLHGRYDDDPVYQEDQVEVVLGEDSYKWAYLRNRPVARILENVISSTRLLIIGASLADEDITGTLRAVSAVQDHGAHSHYILHPLWPQGHENHQDADLLEEGLNAKYHLQPIFWEVEVDDQGRASYTNLERLVEGLVLALDRYRSNRRVPAVPERWGDRDATLALSLTRLLPSPRDFTQVASLVGFEVTRSVLARSPLDRWHSLVRTASLNRKEEDLFRAAAGLLPQRRAEELRAHVTSCQQPLPNRIRIANTLEAFVPAFFGPSSGLEAGSWSPRDDLGLLALDRYWQPRVDPKCFQIDRWIVRLDPGTQVYKRAHAEGLLARDGTFAKPDLGIEAAADFLVRRCAEQEETGQSLIGWALPRLAECQALRHEILLYLLAWWPPATTTVMTFLETGLGREPPDPVQHLVELTFAERLQREAGLPLSIDQVEVPFSIQWAQRAGLDHYTATVLEILGEWRPEIYLHYLRKARGATRIALARALRRCVRQNSPLGEPVLDSAIEATQPSTSVERILYLTKKPQVRKTWLDILPIDPEPPQIEALGQLLSDDTGRRAARTAIRSAERLSEHPDLVRVWDVLGERRRLWIKRLEPTRLPQHAVRQLLEILGKRTLPPEEAADFHELQQQLRQPKPLRPNPTQDR